MEKQIKIEMKGGCIQYITTNFDCSYQVIDYDNDEWDQISDIYEPDEVLIDQEIFE